jgi:CBS domain-containing protein
MFNEFYDLKVHQAMTKDIIAADTSNKISQVATVFAEKNFHHIPVLENGIVVGIISVKDVLKKIMQWTVANNMNTDFRKLDAETSLKSVMTPNPVTISPEATLEEAKKILAKSNFQALPVVLDGKIVGILTTKDFVRLKVIKIEGSDYNPI